MQNNKEEKKTTLKTEDISTLPLLRNNFIFMAICGVLIVLGFVLMLGSSSTPEAYNPDIFSVRRVVIGPAITFLGFALMVVAIIIKPRSKK